MLAHSGNVDARPSIYTVRPRGVIRYVASLPSCSIMLYGPATLFTGRFNCCWPRPCRKCEGARCCTWTSPSNGRIQQLNVQPGHVGIAYLALTWLLMQVADLVLSTFGADRGVMQSLIIVFAVGFPIAVGAAWAYELTPEGVKRSEDVSPRQSIAQQNGRILRA